MPFLIDTSILGRLANRPDLSHPVAVAAIAELHRRGEVLHVTPQNLVEFHNFAIKPVSANGLELAMSAAQGLAATFEAAFPLLDETPKIFPAWKSLVGALGVVGEQVHDARLVGVCHVHAVTHMLTFNVSHFRRMAGFWPGIVIVDPANV